MKRVLAVVLVAGCLSLLGACGGDACDDAEEKLDECGLPSTVGSCDDATDECEADCINSHSCDEITGALAGTPNDYSDCDDACN
ncbi:MAG: hypothetical protein HYY06_08395 [Deltaproteobacteria bacterium]|nr:hypothetical protein [Deltaproteobacteria bacterium]